MMGIAKLLPFITVFITFLATLLLAWGFFPNHWLKKSFTLNMPATILAERNPAMVFAFVPKAQIPLLKLISISMNVTSEMGLYQNCKTSHGEFSGMAFDVDTCDSEGASNWQKIAFGTAGLSLLLGAATFILSILSVTMRRFKDNPKTSFAMVVSNFLTGVFGLVPVILYMTFRRMDVLKEIHAMVEFDFDWAIRVFLAAICFYGLLVVINAFNLFIMSRGYEGAFDDVDGDKGYSMNGGLELNGKASRKH